MLTLLKMYKPVCIYVYFFNFILGETLFRQYIRIYTYRVDFDASVCLHMDVYIQSRFGPICMYTYGCIPTDVYIQMCTYGRYIHTDAHTNVYVHTCRMGAQSCATDSKKSHQSPQAKKTQTRKLK